MYPTSLWLSLQSYLDISQCFSIFHCSGSELTPWYAQVSGTASSSIGSCRCAATTCSCDNGNSTASCDLRRRGEDSYMPNWRSRGVASVKDGWWVEAEYNHDMIIHDPIWSYSYRIFLDLLGISWCPTKSLRLKTFITWTVKLNWFPEHYDWRNWATRNCVKKNVSYHLKQFDNQENL